MSTDLRRRVLDASLDLVATGGVAALSMREVARRAGVSHQAPYRHFADREAILAALVGEGFGELADRMEAAGRAGDAGAARRGLVERLAAVGHAYVAFARERPGHYRLLFRPDLVDVARFPEVAAQGGRAFAALRGLAAEARAAGRLGALSGTEEEREELFVATAWSTVHGLAGLLLDGPMPTTGARLGAGQLAELVPRALASLLGPG